MQARRGFTLIELMVTVVIVGILVAIALPLYRDYSVRARVSEVVLATSTCRNVISEAVQTATQADLTEVLRASCDIVPTQYVAAGTVTIGGNSRGDNAVGIRVEARNLGGGIPDNSAIMMVPMTADGPLFAERAGGATITTWRCAPADVGLSLNQRYLPPSCRS